MSETAWPGLGFDPVPGVPADVQALTGRVDTAVRSLADADSLLRQVRGDAGVWRGAAADAFRKHLNESLATQITHAHTSLEQAVGVLRGWHSELVGLRETAGRLDQEAVRARQRQAQAREELSRAQANPNLGLAGQVFADAASLAHAQGLLDAAEAAVRAAGAAEQEAAGALAAILRQAKELAGEHDQIARRVAAELRHALDRLASREPGLLDRLAHDFTSALTAVDGWVKDHLDAIHSTLTTIAAISALVAVVTPPPVDAIALCVAVVAGVGGLGVDAADPKFRHGITELAHGHFDKESLKAAERGGLDLLSIVPGAGIAKGMLKGSSEVAEATAKLPKVVDIASEVAHKPGMAVKNLAKIPAVRKGLVAAKLIDKRLAHEDEIVTKALNILWHGKSVLSQGIHDVRQATS